MQKPPLRQLSCLPHPPWGRQHKTLLPLIHRPKQANSSQHSIIKGIWLRNVLNYEFAVNDDRPTLAIHTSPIL